MRRWWRTEVGEKIERMARDGLAQLDSLPQERVGLIEELKG